MKGLFVSHAASRTGAPKILLYIMQYLKKHTNLDMEVLLRQDGDLRVDFEELGPTFVWNQSPERSLVSRAISKATGKQPHPNSFIDHFKAQSYDFIYVNSAACADIVVSLGNLSDSQIILHVHELEFNLQNMIPEDLRIKAFARTDKIIAVSELVKRNLKENHGIAEDKLELVYEFIPEIKKFEQQADIRKQYGIKDDELLVGGSGLVNWRKGTDLFLMVAHELKKRKITGIRFMWLGGFAHKKYFKQLIADHEKLGLGDSCIMVPHVENSYDYMHAFDVFLMLSREDPFPLVAIENGQLGHPIYCFNGCTGTEEFIDDSCGGVVDFMDIDSLADKLIELKENPELLRSKGEEVARRFSQFDIESSGSRILSIIQAMVPSL